MLGAGSYLAVDEGYSSRKHTAHHNGVLVDGQGFDNEDRYHIFKGLGAERTARIVTTTRGGGWINDAAILQHGLTRDPQPRTWAVRG